MYHYFSDHKNNINFEPHPKGVTPNSEGQRPRIYQIPDGGALHRQHHRIAAWTHNSEQNRVHKNFIR